MEEVILTVGREYKKKIKDCKTLTGLDKIFLELFGKNGQITLLPKQFSSFPKNEVKKIGPIFNKVKSALEIEVENRRTQVKEEGYQKLINEGVNLDHEEEIESKEGQLHPLTIFEHQIADIFSNLSFQQYDAPEIDTDQNNFEVLNIPKNHPSRDLQDTFYIDTSNKDIAASSLVLRTHTSNSQIRIMQEFKPPIRLMNIGRCFRFENLDARHEHTFDQFELVFIDKGLSMANLLFLSDYYLKTIFGPKVKARLRPKYYPFVEPGAGVDGLCIFCEGKGCKICGGVGWLELGGAGMIHPQVLKNGGVDPKVYSGIAWGTSPDRMVMLRYGIKDIRLLRSANLELLRIIKP